MNARRPQRIPRLTVSSRPAAHSLENAPVPRRGTAQRVRRRDGTPAVAPPSTRTADGRRIGSSTRRAALTLSVALMLTLAFSVSYMGAYHDPTPHGVPIGALAPAGEIARVARRLDDLPGHPLAVTRASSLASATRAVDARRSYGIYDVGENRLYVASAANRATAVTLEALFARILAGEHRAAPAVSDLKPLPASDPNGTSAFYAMIAWVFGGYLAATLLGQIGSSRSASRRRALLRLAGLAAYALAAGLVTNLVLNAAFGVFGGHVLTMWGVASLVVFATGAAAAGLQAAAGMLGTGIVILLFVMFGNASSGGPYARPLLPGLWRTLGGLFPPGAGVDLARGSLYFGGAGDSTPILVLAAWALAGIVATVALGGRVASESETEAAVAAGALGA